MIVRQQHDIQRGEIGGGDRMPHREGSPCQRDGRGPVKQRVRDHHLAGQTEQHGGVAQPDELAILQGLLMQVQRPIGQRFGRHLARRGRQDVAKPFDDANRPGVSG